VDSAPSLEAAPLRPGRSARQLARLGLGFVAIFTLALALYTRHNGFPTFYNTDEKLKVQYVTEGTTSFNHPLLLMGTSRQAAKALGLKGKKDAGRLKIFVLGRTVSAVFAALAVVALAGVALLQGGAAAAWCVGLLAATSPFLLTLAHYMKEDTALLFGLAAAFLAMALYLRRPAPLNQCLLGAASGLAISGKYAGVVILLATVPVLLLARPAEGSAPERRWRRLGRFALALALVVAVVNSHYLVHFSDFTTGVKFESAHVVSGHHGVKAQSALQRQVRQLWLNTTLPVLILAGGYLAFALATWRRRSWLDRLMILFPIAYFVMLLGSSIHFARYLLPVVIWLHYWAGLAVVEAGRRLPGPRLWRLALVGVLLGVSLLAQGRRSADILGQFGGDSRERLAAWAAANLPPTARVVEDRYARLGAFKESGKYKKRLPCQVTTLKWAAEVGDLDELRKQGFTHVAISSMAFNRFFEKNEAASADDAREFQRRRAFYERLFKEGELVWKAETDAPVGMSTNPFIYVFKVVPAGTPVKNDAVHLGRFLDEESEVQD
jgi:hypothetical protein